MVDFDQSIINNPELGKAANNPFLDEIEAQALENACALAEGREPRKVVSRERFGPYAGRPDNGPLLFEDGTPVFTETNLNDYFQDAEIARVARITASAEELDSLDENENEGSSPEENPQETN